MGLEPQLSRPVYQTCLHRYRDGSPPPAASVKCSCGQYAVGECAVCGKVRCGDHARLFEGRFQCPPHIKDTRARKHAEAVEEIRQAAEPLRRWLESFTEPEERFVTAALHLGIEREPRATYDTRSYVEWTAPDLLHQAFPEWGLQAVCTFFSTTFGTDDKVPPPVSPDHLGAWFRRRAREAGIEPDSTYTPTIQRKSEALRAGRSDIRIDGSPALTASTIPAMSADQRIEAALIELAARGVQPTARRVPGFYQLSLSSRLLGRLGKDVEVTVESAFPVGTCTWSQPGPHGTDRYENLPTGITPSRRIVPMTRATAGDDVEMTYRRWKRGIDKSAGQNAGVQLYPEQIANALESLLR